MFKKQPLSEQLKQTWIHYRNQVQISRKKANSLNIHRLRVVTQRFQAILKLTQSLAPKHETELIIHSLKKTRRELGNLRDLQIESDLKTGQVGHFSVFVSQEKKLAKIKVKKYLKDLPLKKQKTLLMKVMSKKLIQSEKMTIKQVRNLLAPAVKTTLNRFKKALSETTPKKMKNLHKFRILTKQLRYQEEGIKSACGFTPFNLSKLKKVQNAVGKIQDNNALLKTMNRYLAQKKHRADPLVLKAQKQLHRIQKKQIRQEFKNLSIVQWKN